MNLAIKEHGLAMTNVFNGTFIPEDNKRKERLPVPNIGLVFVFNKWISLLFIW
jgi:hypothetical protein